MSGKSASVPRFALTRREAAQSLGVGLTFFEENVQHELRLVRRKSKVMVPISELERWVNHNAERVLRRP